MTAETILLTKHTEEVTSLQTQHKDAIAALETKHKEAVAALEAKQNEAIAQLAKIGEEVKGLNAALAAKTKEAEDAAKYDMRKAGAPALQIALESHTQKVPAPGKNDAENWTQYHALLTAGNVETAAAFKIKYLTRK